MADNQLVTGASLSDTSVFGVAFAHKALDAYPPGWASFLWGNPIVSNGQNGASVLLDLTGAYTPPAGSAVDIPLSGAPLVLGAMGQLTAFGTPGIANAAQAAQAAGFSGIAFGQAWVTPATPAAGLVIDLSGVYTPPSAANVGIYFGGTEVAVARGWDDTSFGQASVRTAWRIAPAGWQDDAFGNAARVTPPMLAAGFTLDLSGAYTPPAGSAVDIPLSGAPLVLGTMGQLTAFGTPSVGNTARALYPGIGEQTRWGTQTRITPDTEARFLYLNLAGAYTPPSAEAIQIVLGGSNKAASAPGWRDDAFGTAAVVLGPAHVNATGWLDDTFGAARTAWPVRASGFDAGAFGDTNINNLLGPGGLRLTGWLDESFGAHGVQDDVTLRPAGFTGLALGTSQIALKIRTLRMTGFDASAFGDAQAWFRVRTLYPTWRTSNLIFGNALVDRNHWIAPSGWQDDAFGSIGYVGRPFDLLTPAAPIQIDAAYGLPSIRNVDTFALPPGFLAAGAPESARFGNQTLFSMRRVVQQDAALYGAVNTPIVAGPWVANRNGVITYDASDWAPQNVFGIPAIRNGARFISFYEVFWDTSAFGQARIEPRIRTVTGQGFDDTGWGTWLAPQIVNAARALSAKGWQDDAINSDTLVWKNLQTRVFNGWDDTSFGNAFIAPAIRTVQVVQPQHVIDNFGAAQAISWRQIISPPGYNPNAATPQFGTIDIHIHWNTANAQAISPPANQVSAGASIRNVTPELGAWGYDFLQTGKPAIHNQWTAYAMQGFREEWFGTAFIRDRAQRPQPTGFRATAWGQAYVYNIAPDPPAARSVYPAQFPQGSEATGSMARFGAAAARLFRQPAFAQGWDDTVFGRTGVRSMGVFPRGIPPPYSETTGSQFGVPSLPVPTLAIVRPLQTDAQYGTPSISPHYIWAPMGYPYGANAANPGRGEQMDASIFGAANTQRPVFGAVGVSQKNRPLPLPGWQEESFGGAYVSTNPQYVRPAGAKFARYGFPSLDGGGGAQAAGWQDEAFGTAALARPAYTGPQAVSVSGIAVGAFGATRIELKNRTIPVPGWNSFTTSPPGAPAYPIHTTWVSHGPIVAPVQGFDAAQWGTNWISYYVRSVYGAGWDSSALLEYTLGDFKDRLHVSDRTTVRARGWVATGYGTANVVQGTRVVRPASMAGGATGTPRVGRALGAAGWLDELPGTPWYVDQTVPGTLKAKGVDSSAFGRAILDRIVRADGFAGAMGAPRVGSALDVAGIGPAGVGRPIMVAAVCGDKNVVVPHFEAGVFGETGVAHA